MAGPTPSSTSKSRIQRSNFRLRSVFLLVTVCAAYFAYMRSRGAGGILALLLGIVLAVTGAMFWLVTLETAAKLQRNGRWHFLAYTTILAGGCFGAFIGWPIGILFGIALAAIAEIPVALVLVPLDHYTTQCMSNRLLASIWGGLSGLIAGVMAMRLELSWTVLPAAAGFGAIYMAFAGAVRDRYVQEAGGVPPSSSERR